MKSVSVSELKEHLSRYLRGVQRGDEVQILHHGKPIAKLVGLGSSAAAVDERRERLAAAGVLRLGSGNASAMLDEEPLSIDVSLTTALVDERGDRV